MENPSYRVRLVGETTAGKTCILNQIVNQEFDSRMDTNNMFYSKEIVTNNNKNQFRILGYCRS